ncbi:MAG: ATP-binding protein [bacterium]
MLIRVLIKNFLSFNESTEFNLLPNNKRRRHEEHVYDSSSVNLLKVAAVYGNNAAGKTNLIKAVNLLKSIATKKDVLLAGDLYADYIFRLRNVVDNKTPISIALEFIANDSFYYYHTDILSNSVVNEQLSVKNCAEDVYLKIFATQYTQNDRELIVYDESGNVIENYIDDRLLSYLNKNVKSSILSLQQDYPVIANSKIEDAINWLSDKLRIINTEGILNNIINVMYEDIESQEYINKILPTLSLGVDHISVSTKPLSEILDSENNADKQEIAAILNNMPAGVTGFSKIDSNKTPLISVTKENDVPVVRQLMFSHHSEKGDEIELTINHQSDGTKYSIVIMYLLDKLINRDSIIFIDELEKSMHPMIVKNLLEIFLQNKNSKGQLVFTTHESYLLDQDLLRADEIWFVEKQNASTRLYSLNDFKEHSAIDIQKGYLAGRYGAIPYLSARENLSDNED